MFFVDELTNLKLYKKEFSYPLVDSHKKSGSLAFIFSPNYESANRIMNHRLFKNRYFYSYYLERGVTYYIQNEYGLPKLHNDGSIVINEAYNDILLKDEKVIYSGFQDDIDEVSKVLNGKSIKNFANEYGIKVKYPIRINIHKKTTPPPPKRGEINVSSRFDYGGKIYKNYNSYLIYEMIDALLSREIPWPPLVRAVALYESGLYELHKSSWPFDPRLKTMCKKVERYINNHGKTSFVRDAVHADSKGRIGFVFKEDASDEMWQEPIHELYVEPKYRTDSDISGILGKNNSIKIDEAHVLVFNEDAAFNSNLKKILYADRIKTNNDLGKIYDRVKKDNPFIKYAYYDLNRYKGLNLFYDASYYMDTFMRVSTYKGRKASNILFELIKRIVNDARIPSEYEKKTIVIPVIDWDNNPDIRIYDFIKTVNPFTALYNYLYNVNIDGLKDIFGDTDFLFLGENSYFKINFSQMTFTKTHLMKMMKNIERLRSKTYVSDEDNDEPQSSTKAITVDIVDKVEKSQGVKIDDISTKDTTKDDKDKIVDKVSKVAKTSSSVDDALEVMDSDEEVKKLIMNISNDADVGPQISAARASRNIQLNKELMDKEIKGRKIQDILDDRKNEELEEISVNVDSVNDEWKHLTYQSSMDKYDTTNDIVEVFRSFAETSHPLVIRTINVENTSTSEDKKETYTVEYENENGKRFTVKVDVPVMIDNKYMKLRGNIKNINGQIISIPVCKTDEDTVQVTSYAFGRKIFIERFGSTSKSNISSCKLSKALSKGEFKNITVTEGDCTKVCSKYEVPFDYIDLGSIYNKIITPTYTFFFNQDEIREKYKIDDDFGLPYGVENKTKKILYYNGNDDIMLSTKIAMLLSSSDEDFASAYNSASPAVRYTYSRAKILNAQLPLIVVCAYSEGLQRVLKKANIEYEIIPKDAGRPKYDSEVYDIIKFNDGWIKYKLSYASSLFMNGLKACPTEAHSLMDIDSKPMYLDFFDTFGGRIMVDGIDNFYDLMIDPITKDALIEYKLPTDYVEVLVYANSLLADNKYISHASVTYGRRVRRNELIPCYLYSALSRSYEDYTRSMKHGRQKPMSIKQSAPIDAILVDNTVSDLSILTPSNEYEAINTISPKGLSGLNTDRAYTLDKRVFDDSMINVFSMSTGFASNIGINRQATIDMNITGKRGYIKAEKEPIKELSLTKSFCMTEALTPFGSTRDDPFRTAMTFIQTSKHLMRTYNNTPSLITSGADEALPYLISNIFAFKAKENGEVLELVPDDYMIISYNDGTSDYVDLSERVEKNSSSGFYVTLKLDTDLKQGSKIKKGQILAYDKSSFSDEVGPGKDIAFKPGTLKKCAIINTSEGYEDSVIISKDLSSDLSNSVVLKVDKSFSKDTNIYDVIKVGDEINEGDSLMIIQQPFDDADTNTLLRNLTGVDEDEVSDLGRVKIKSKVTGTVQDIIMYRTVELDELSPTLQKLFKAYEKNITTKKKKLESFGLPTHDLPATYKLPATGKLKDCENGVKIEFYLRYEDKMYVGDKLIFFSALKGTVQSVFPEGKEPTSSFRPDEKIHSLLTTGSVNGRMVSSVFINGGINKFIIELFRKCKDIAGIKYDVNDI